MGVGISGDHIKLGKLHEAVAKASNPQWMVDLNKNLAQEARTQMVQGFLAQRDPYGTKWKNTLRGDQILRKTTRLMNSVMTRANVNSYELYTAVKYARIHQYGGVISAIRSSAGAARSSRRRARSRSGCRSSR